MLKRSLLAALAIVALVGNRDDRQHPAVLRPHGGEVPLRRHGPRADPGPERQAADDPAGRLRPPPRRQEAGTEAALGHDHPGPVDPGKGVALLSLPRDLKVEIPNHGTDKINIAYTLGGPKLTIKTVKQLTGLAINHYVDVAFHGFAEGVNAIGCVYADVDRRYFNDNSGLGPGANYAVINVKPGYQKLAARRPSNTSATGTRTPTSFGAHASRTSCARYAGQVTASKLIGKTGKLINIFANNTASDIKSSSALRRLLALMLGVQGQADQAGQVPRPPGRVVRDGRPAQVNAAVRQLLYVKKDKGARGSASATRSPAGRSTPRPTVNLIDATVASRQQAQLAQPHVGFPVYYPRKLVPTSSFVQDGRAPTRSRTRTKAPSPGLQDGHLRPASSASTTA